MSFLTTGPVLTRLPNMKNSMKVAAVALLALAGGTYASSRLVLQGNPSDPTVRIYGEILESGGQPYSGPLTVTVSQIAPEGEYTWGPTELHVSGGQFLNQEEYPGLDVSLPVTVSASPNFAVDAPDFKNAVFTDPAEGRRVLSRVNVLLPNGNLWLAKISTVFLAEPPGFARVTINDGVQSYPLSLKATAAGVADSPPPNILQSGVASDITVQTNSMAALYSWTGSDSVWIRTVYSTLSPAMVVLKGQSLVTPLEPVAPVKVSYSSSSYPVIRHATLLPAAGYAAFDPLADDLEIVAIGDRCSSGIEGAPDMVTGYAGGELWFGDVPPGGYVLELWTKDDVLINYAPSVVQAVQVTGGVINVVTVP